LARLPSDVDLGGSPSGNSGRPIATYDVTGYARGAAAIGQGVSDFGKGVQTAARDISAVNTQQQSDTDALEEARAHSNYLIKTKQIRDELSTVTDPTDLEKTYAPKFQAAYDESASMISNPRKREMWTLKTAPDLTGQTIAVGDKVYDLQKTQTIADTNQKLDEIRNAALRTQDPAERAKFIAAGQQLLTGLKEAGYIDAVTEQANRKKWAQDYAVSAIQMMPPQDRVKELSSVVQGKDQILDRFNVIEGNTASGTSSADGYFQFTKGTWLDTVQAHRPDLMQGRSVQDVLALRKDPKVAREMAGYLLDDNSAILRNQGIAPTPANLYLAHFLGPGDAAKVLRAAPGTPVSDIVSPASIAANKSVLEGKTTDTVIDWSSRKMGSAQRGKGGLVDFIPEDKAYDMLHTARQEVEGGTIEQQRQIKLQAEQVKAQSDSAENEIIGDLYSDKPKYTVQSIATDARLTPAAKERMISAAGRALGADKSDKTYGPAFMSAYQRIHAPDGSPEKITDPSMLYPMVGQKDGLTVQGVDKLVSEINSRKTPEGVAEAEMKKQFLKNAKSQISGADEGLHIPDPKGEQLYLRWLAQALPSYEAGKKAGKTPSQLLDPASPDYVGKSIDQFKRPPSEWYNDLIHDQPTATAAPTFDATKIQSLSELVAAYRGGKVSKAVADQLAIDRGWAVPRVAPAAVSVPVSQ
jgi:hypothetical protein